MTLKFELFSFFALYLGIGFKFWFHHLWWINCITRDLAWWPFVKLLFVSFWLCRKTNAFNGWLVSSWRGLRKDYFNRSSYNSIRFDSVADQTTGLVTRDSIGADCKSAGASQAWCKSKTTHQYFLWKIREKWNGSWVGVSFIRPSTFSSLAINRRVFSV